MSVNAVQLLHCLAEEIDLGDEAPTPQHKALPAAGAIMRVPAPLFRLQHGCYSGCTKAPSRIPM